MELRKFTDFTVTRFVQFCEH